MNTNKKERLRKVLLKRDFLSGKRTIEKFLANKISFNDYFKSKIAEYPDMRAAETMTDAMTHEDDCPFSERKSATSAAVVDAIDIMMKVRSPAECLLLARSVPIIADSMSERKILKKIEAVFKLDDHWPSTVEIIS